jgi:hypothetical protein
MLAENTLLMMAGSHVACEWRVELLHAVAFHVQIAALDLVDCMHSAQLGTNHLPVHMNLVCTVVHRVAAPACCCQQTLAACTLTLSCNFAKEPSTTQTL